MIALFRNKRKRQEDSRKATPEYRHRHKEDSGNDSE